MAKYEFTFLLPEESQVEPIKKLLDSVKGKLVEEQKWGKKDLVYPIDKHTSAYYFTWVIDVAPKALSEMKSKLGFNEQLLRYVLLKVE